MHFFESNNTIELNKKFVKDDIPVDQINTKWKSESSKLTYFGYVILKIKNIISKNQSKELLEMLDFANLVHNKIFNESIFYKLYFDVEKMKRMMFKNEKLIEFENTKLCSKSLFRENSRKKTKTKSFF